MVTDNELMCPGALPPRAISGNGRLRAQLIATVVDRVGARTREDQMIFRLDRKMGGQISPSECRRSLRESDQVRISVAINYCRKRSEVLLPLYQGAEIIL